MSYQHKDNSGSLFKNDKRESDKHPNAKGSAVIDGVEYWVSAWVNDGNKGKYQSLKFERKDKQSYSPSQQNQLHNEGAAKNSPGSKPADDFDSDLPF
jgi:hypothetical protein